MKSGKIFKKGPLISEVEVAPGQFRRRYKKVLDLEAMKSAKKKQVSKAPETESPSEETPKKAAPKKKASKGLFGTKKAAPKK
tara:strand:- start:16 stop:261 length:246 start_codon:yes stop_codon:yes gene_type:complete